MMLFSRGPSKGSWVGTINLFMQAADFLFRINGDRKKAQLTAVQSSTTALGYLPTEPLGLTAGKQSVGAMEKKILPVLQNALRSKGST